MKPKSLVAEAKEIGYRKGFSDAEFTVKNAMRREARIEKQQTAAFLEEQAAKILCKEWDDGETCLTQKTAFICPNCEVAAALREKAKEMRK